ncbi:MAG: hypothetical protein ACEPOV_06185 [Hyphomicrobiales bacterium]
MENITKKEKGLRILKWTIRGIGLLFVLPSIIMAISEGLPPFPEQLSLQVIYVSLFVIWLGVFIGFWKEIVGGIMIIVAIAAVFISESNFNLGSSFLIYVLVAVGYIGVWYERRKINRFKDENH